jgi:hypothetical protein
MASIDYCGSNHNEWEAAGLKDYGDFAECVSFLSQRPDYGGSDRGEWFYDDAETLTVYGGTFGNDHSPGASHYTYAEVYDCVEEYEDRVAVLEAKPEWLDTDDDTDDDDDDDIDDEPQDGDYQTEDHQRFYQYGKLVLTVPEDGDHVAAIRDHMRHSGFYPSAWFISDHGNAHQIDMSAPADEAP